jgi:hypothetical protein
MTHTSFHFHVKKVEIELTVATEMFADVLNGEGEDSAKDDRREQKNGMDYIPFLSNVFFGSIV